MKFIAIGSPDEENARSGHHTKYGTWEFEASSMEEAERKAREHLYYFHELGVYEIKEEEK